MPLPWLITGTPGGTCNLPGSGEGVVCAWGGTFSQVQVTYQASSTKAGPYSNTATGPGLNPPTATVKVQVQVGGLWSAEQPASGQGHGTNYTTAHTGCTIKTGMTDK